MKDVKYLYFLSSLKVLAVLTRVNNNTSKEASLLVHYIGDKISPANAADLFNSFKFRTFFNDCFRKRDANVNNATADRCKK